jgi:hypothetical protein
MVAGQIDTPQPECPFFSMLVSGRVRIMAVAVRPGNLAILIVDDQLGTLVPADFPSSLDGFPFGFAVKRSPFRATPLDIPPAIGLGDHMMSLATTFGHF